MNIIIESCEWKWLKMKCKWYCRIPSQSVCDIKKRNCAVWDRNNFIVGIRGLGFQGRKFSFDKEIVNWFILGG